MRRTLVGLCMVLLAACGSDSETNTGWQVEDDMPVIPEEDVGADADVTPEVPTGTIANGQPCAESSECIGGTCLTSEEYPEGYCTQGCAEGCAEGSVCTAGDYCAPVCVLDDQCRAGYACAQTPSGQRACVPPTGVSDGSACAASGDCQSGTCIEEWPDGYCTTVGCDTYEDCARQGDNNRCLQLPDQDNLCVRICERNSDCREGYVCERLNVRQGFCAPDPRVPLTAEVLEGNPFDIQCVDGSSGGVDIEFTIAPETYSYMITPFAPGKNQIGVRNIGLPSGQTINLNSGQNAFQSIPNQIFKYLNPTVIPAVPQFQSQLEAGNHTYRVATGSEDLCWYLLEKEVPGNVIDVNIYLVGLAGITAANAPQDPNFAEVLEEFDKLYKAAGVSLRTVRFFDVSEEASQRFGVIRDEASLPVLLQESVRPGNTMEDVLSVNLFFVRAFNLGGAIGISQGLPGPAGFHGMDSSGVIFTSQYMGRETRDGFNQPVDGNYFTAQVLAHEVGHYLGLFHTSEQNGQMFDPILDTPTCGRIAADCPDISNLMFPFASALNTEISPDQAFVLKVSPLTQNDPAYIIEDPDMGEDMGEDMGSTDMGDMGLADMDDMGSADMGGEQ